MGEDNYIVAGIFNSFYVDYEGKKLVRNDVGQIDFE